MIGADADPSVSGKLVKLVKIDLTEEMYGIGVDKAQPELLEQVNAFIEEIQKNGEFDEICNHYFGDGEPKPVEFVEENPKKDQLIVGTAMDFEPFEYRQGDKYYGIDLELANLLAKRLGKELVIVNSSFEMMFMSVKEHRCDLCLGAITINDSRKEYFEFSEPYYTVAQWLIVPEGNTEFDDARTAEDVQDILKGKDRTTVVGVENLTTAQYYCEGSEQYGYEGFPVTVKPYRDASAAIEAMIDGEVDYVMGDSVANSF
ncbi:MAG: transporter substrate-binding domain-containing protein, partial [Lachnospiraceae bacterium]|nr:transporter substrate-binding domain-containing protein [Lachnospiraceae bacterium]